MAVPSTFIEAVFQVMNRASRHTFQVLTKRPGRVVQLDRRLQLDAKHLAWYEHRVGTVASGRLAPLRETGAQTKFLSLEPLLGPLPGLSLENIDWVIVGVSQDRAHGRWKPTGSAPSATIA